MCFDSNNTEKMKKTKINGVKATAEKKKQMEMKQDRTKPPGAGKALEQKKGILKSNPKGKS